MSIEQKKYGQWILTSKDFEIPPIEINATKKGLELKGYGTIPWKDLQEFFDQSWTYAA